ncbi:MAG: hypothetical protein EHM61_00630 [Acidobacteria bacterium]|nr:MAG: hypothetical protein EHM61_00630 [Acidobacteriota bacterium]
MKFLLHTLVGLSLLAGSAWAQMGPGGSHGPGLGDMTGHAGRPLEHNLVLPQLAIGPDITISIVLLNWGNTQRMPWATAESLKTTGRVLFFDSSGNPLTVRVNDSANQSEHPFTLEASQMVRLNLTSPDSNTKVGWALIEVDEPISQQTSWGMMGNHPIMRGEKLSASAVFSVRQGAQLRSQAGVIPSMFERSQFVNSVMPASADANGETGVAIVNTSAKTVDIQLTLKNADGTTAGQTVVGLAAGNQTAKFIRELFGNQVPASFDGYMEVTSTGEGTVTMAIMVSQGVLTAIPTHHTGAMRQGM